MLAMSAEDVGRLVARTHSSRWHRLNAGEHSERGAARAGPAPIPSVDTGAPGPRAPSSSPILAHFRTQRDHQRDVATNAQPRAQSWPASGPSVATWWLSPQPPEAARERR